MKKIMLGLYLMSAVTAVIGSAYGQSVDSQSPLFTASPTSGPAPLRVTFCASAGIGIDFGDGGTSGMGIARKDDCPRGGSSFATHTYSMVGTYQLRGFPCPSPHENLCGEVARQASTLKIVVTAPP